MTTPEENLLRLQQIEMDTVTRDLVRGWSEAIENASIAGADAANARRAMQRGQVQVDLAEARALLSAEGKNEASRKAAATIALEDDATYTKIRDEVIEERWRVGDAERRNAAWKDVGRLHRVLIDLRIANGG